MFRQMEDAVSKDVRSLLEDALDGRELSTAGAERLLLAQGAD